MTGQFSEFMVSNDALDDPSELRSRMDDLGYLFFRKLQDPDKLLDLRKDILSTIQAGGWLVPGSNLIDGIADPSKRCTEGDPEYPAVYHEVYKLESFHSAAHWAPVVDTMSKIVNGSAVPHPSKIARLWFPQFTDHTTPAHQDFVHFQGDFDTYTCWTPVGDCPRELGGLAIKPRTHKSRSVYDHHFSLGAGSLTVEGDDLEGDWLTTDYEIGDCLMFHSLTLHQALPNITEDRLRISLDNRYQSLESPIGEFQLVPHMSQIHPLPWDEVYANWESTELQYYWLNMFDEIIPRDNSYADKGFTEALSLATTGDDKAILKLRRTITNNPYSDDANAASAVLKDLDLL